MKDRNKQERPIPRHNEDQDQQEGFRGSSKTDRNENVRSDQRDRQRSDRQQSDRQESDRNRDLE